MHSSQNSPDNYHLELIYIITPITKHREVGIAGWLFRRASAAHKNWVDDEPWHT